MKRFSFLPILIILASCSKINVEFNTDAGLSLADVLAPKLLAGDCLDPDLSQIPTTVSLMLCDGSMASGSMVLASSCSSSGEVGCLTTASFIAADISEIPGKVIIRARYWWC
jgi:hypothetical protein